MKSKYQENLQDVQAHLNMIQSVINRMASNGASCKNWCIPLVSAILVVVINQNKPVYYFISLIPTLLFCYLDTRYFLLEREFVESYKKTVKKLHTKGVLDSDLYKITPSENKVHSFFQTLKSFAIWPFYLTLVGITMILYFIKS